MGNVSRAKKVLAIVLAVTCMMVFSFGTVFAAGSPTKGKKTTVPGNKYVTEKSGNAYHYGLTKKAKKRTSITVNNTVTRDGYTYKVVGIKANAFKGSKAKTIKLKGNVTKISKKAFNGSKVSKSKIVVKIKKSAYSKKQIASLKKQLKAAGIKAKNIKFY